MLTAAIMDGKDTLTGSLAECFFTIDGRRYTGMQFISVTAKMTKTKNEVPILGRVGKGNKSTGWRGTGTATLHYMSPQFRRKALEYIKSGKDFYFDMQITNEDSTSGAGRQTVILKHCNIDEITLTEFDANSNMLQEDMPFTFDDVEIPEHFGELEGM